MAALLRVKLLEINSNLFSQVLLLQKRSTAESTSWMVSFKMILVEAKMHSILYTLGETNSSHLKIGRAPKGNERIPIIQFRLELLVSGSV